MDSLEDRGMRGHGQGVKLAEPAQGIVQQRLARHRLVDRFIHRRPAPFLTLSIPGNFRWARPGALPHTWRTPVVVRCRTPLCVGGESAGCKREPGLVSPATFGAGKNDLDSEVRMATVQECRKALETLTGRLSDMDAEDRAAKRADRKLSGRVP